MTPEQKAVLLDYCRIDELTAADEDVLYEMVCAAENYMAEAGITKPDAGTPRRAQYELCVKALVLDDWDRRGTMDTGRGTYQATDNKSFRQRIKQLQLTEPVPESDTM